jgi:O-succinylbenzoic acid--CoA ligase
VAEIRCPLYEAALISKHEPAMVCAERVILYYELDDMVSRVAARLREAGCRPGDRVGFFLPQDWRYVAVLLGALRAGCVACPMNTRLPPDRALEHFAGIESRTVIARVGEERRRALADFRVLDPDDLLAHSAVEAPFEWTQHMALDLPATVVFTSGSAGAPKAVLHTYANHYYSARASNLNIRVRSHDRWLLSLPLYHVGGLGIVFRCLLAGAAIAIPEPDETVSAAMARMEITHLSVVATQLQRLLAEETDAPTLGRLKAVLLGGGPVSPRLVRDALARKLPVHTSYGLTEMTSQVCTTRSESPPAKRYSSGLPLRHAQVKVAEDGEILVRGETLFAGYVDGRKLEPATDASGWFHTGDLGALDAEGYLSVSGRKDNMFVSGGENIHPEEIERAIASCEGVEDCIVVPVPDEEFGARPVAFIKGSRSHLADLERALPRFKIPREYLPWPSDAESGAKPDREKLAELARRATRT